MSGGTYSAKVNLGKSEYFIPPRCQRLHPWFKKKGRGRGVLEITSSSNRSEFAKGGGWVELTESEVTKKYPSQSTFYAI